MTGSDRRARRGSRRDQIIDSTVSSVFGVVRLAFGGKARPGQ